MSTNRQPAGTSVGGQWAPGAASEVEMDLDDAFDDTFDAPELTLVADSDPEYQIAKDGGFDFGLEAPPAPKNRTLSVAPGEKVSIRPGDIARIDRGKDTGKMFVLAGTRGLAVLESSGTDRDPDYEIVTLRPSTTGSGSAFVPRGVEQVSDRNWEIVDDDTLFGDDIKKYGGSRGKGKSARKALEDRASIADIGAPTAEGERAWCQQTNAGPEYASHPLAREKAYNFVAERPDLSLRPSPDFGAKDPTTGEVDPDFIDDWDDFDGLDPAHRNQVFARRFIQGGAEEHFYADGPEIYCHRWPDNTTERVGP